MKNKKILLILSSFALLSLILTYCYSPNENENKTIQNGNGIVKGKVFDGNGTAISGVKVTCDGKQTYSGPDGGFTLKDVTAGTRKLVNFTKDNYVSNQKIMKITSLKTSYTEAALYDIGTTKNVNSSSAFNISTNGAMVDFQANSLVGADGKAFGGQATIKMTYFDPTSSKFFDAFPGEFMGVQTDNIEVPIESYGFIDVEMFNGTEKLQLAKGKPATLTIPIPAKLLANAPSTIPLWDYDTQKGKWIELGVATRNGNKYSGQVTHFSKINLDMKYEELCQVKGKVVDQNGNPLPNSWIKLTGVDFAGGGSGYSDENGEFEFIRVKGNGQITLIAYSSGFYSTPLNITTGANGTTTDAGTLVITIDPNLVSGWTEIGTLPPAGITDMQFIDANTGWMISNGIYRTDDGGATWVLQKTGGGNDSSSIRAIQMLDANNGWACGSKLYYTNDGGTTWNEANPGAGNHYYYDVFFVNANYGWVIGSPSYKTTDGGTTWTTMNLGAGQNTYYSKAFFVDQNNGYVFAYGVIKKTTDGGDTFTDDSIPNSRYGMGSLFFIDANTGWIVISGEKGQTKVYYTNDGCATLQDQTPAQAATLNDVFFISSTEGWMAGGAGTIFHTTDGGQNWTFQFNKSNNANFTKIFFVNNKIGWVAGSINYSQPKLMYTTTGGEPQ